MSAAASCSPQAQEMASYRLRPMLWKGLGPALCGRSVTAANLTRCGGGEGEEQSTLFLKHTPFGFCGRQQTLYHFDLTIRCELAERPAELTGRYAEFGRDGG